MFLEQLAEGGSSGFTLVREELQPAVHDETVALGPDQPTQPALDCQQRLGVLALPPRYLQVQHQALRSTQAYSDALGRYCAGVHDRGSNLQPLWGLPACARQAQCGHNGPRGLAKRSWQTPCKHTRVQ
jgi:hypothetical protein